MRLRHKPKAVARLPQHKYYIENPTEHRGNWQKLFSKAGALSLELGCGFGRFATEYATLHPERNLLSVDKSRDVLVGACRLVEFTFGDDPENLRISDFDAYHIEDCLDRSDGVEQLFIFFCNPWPKRSHHRRRLTYPALLKRYQKLMMPGAMLYFKTDDEGLYRASLKYFDECRLETLFFTENLASDHGFEPLSIKTEYEQKFIERGQQIYAAVVRF